MEVAIDKSEGVSKVVDFPYAGDNDNDDLVVSFV